MSKEEFSEEFYHINDLAVQLREENKEAVEPLMQILEAEDFTGSNKALWKLFSIGGHFALFMAMVGLNVLGGFFLIGKLLMGGSLASLTGLVVLLLFLAVFPVVYVFLGYKYSVSKAAWEAYDSLFRPILKKMVVLLVTQLAKQMGYQPDGARKTSIIQTVKNYIEGITNRIPKFLRKYLNPLSLATQTVDKVQVMAAQEDVSSPSFVDRCANFIFSSVDQQTEDQLKPSFTPFLVTLAINALVFIMIIANI